MFSATYRILRPFRYWAVLNLSENNRVSWGLEKGYPEVFQQLPNADNKGRAGQHTWGLYSGADVT